MFYKYVEKIPCGCGGCFLLVEVTDHREGDYNTRNNKINYKYKCTKCKEILSSVETVIKEEEE